MHIEVQYIRKQYEKVGEEIKEELKKNPSQGSTIIHAEGCHTPALFRKPELYRGAIHQETIREGRRRDQRRIKEEP
ncbi:hypothetical protein QE152_g10438 [Popillia japonica]|uniref:Uncharacterized protein n=1 Tax=Popillia japonica TaxID=7064 RepID=A0AAW1LWD1_POPJA